MVIWIEGNVAAKDIPSKPIIHSNIGKSHCPLVDVELIFKVWFSKSLYRIVVWVLAVKFILAECHKTSLMISQHWFRQWLGAVRQQAITWANVDPGFCPYMATLGHNELRTSTLSTLLLNFADSFAKFQYRSLPKFRAITNLWTSFSCLQDCKKNMMSYGTEMAFRCHII